MYCQIADEFNCPDDIYHYIPEDNSTILNDGELIIAGIVQCNSYEDKWDMMLLGVNATGSLIRNSTYAGESWTSGCSLVACQDGGFAVAGLKISSI